MDLGLKGKVALVTGGSRGIGRATALALAREGAEVVISYSSNEDAAKETVADIERAGGKATHLGFDVQEAAACQDAIKKVTTDKGALHILVSNAGVAVDSLVMRIKDEDLERLFRTNVFASVYLARAAVRPMMKAKWGRIILMGSVIGQMGNAGQSAYASTKSALHGLSKSMAKELGSRNLTVNVIAPGFIQTDMTQKMPEEAVKALQDAIPSSELGQPEDVAQAVCFLASDRARYITGHILDVNGGLYM